MLRLHHQIKGQGSPLIMLHGLFGSLENLSGIARLLASDFSVHLLDLRNHGRSPHHPQMSYADMATDVIHYMNEADLGSSHLLGHSMGGKTVMQLALNHPGRVNRLIVADIAPVTYPAHHDHILQGLSEIDPDRLKSRQQADQMLKNKVPELAIRQFLLKNLVKEKAEGFRWRINLAAIRQNYSHIMSGQHHAPAFPGKTLFVKGGRSEYLKPQYREHSLRLFPKAKIRVITSAGHWLHIDRPTLFAGIVKQFLITEE